MRADGIEVNVIVKPHGNFSERLHAVAVKYRAGILFFHETGKPRDIVYRARLVVDVYDADKRSLLVYKR